VIVQEILRDHQSRNEQVQAWTKRTGKSPRAFYRRLAEMR
jgi:NAD-specific glutamate dehydrogenase